MFLYVIHNFEATILPCAAKATDFSGKQNEAYICLVALI